MIVIPAVDVREGACVQLVGGSYAHEQVRLPDPIEAARRWAREGFRHLHVVDLDAATDRGSNAAVIMAVIVEATRLGLEVQAGGGVRDDATVARLFEAGAERVVVGTRAAEDPDWLVRLAQRHPESIVAAADTRERRVVARGWQNTLAHDVVETVRRIGALPLAGILVTAVHKEGRLQGTDLPLMREVAAATRTPVIASGGITTIKDLRSLAGCGIAGAVIGMALYTGALDPRATVKEFVT